MAELPKHIIKEAESLHDCLQNRGHLNINELLSFLQKIVKLSNPKRKPAKKRRGDYDLFLYHLENLSKK